MRQDLDAVWIPMQQEIFAETRTIEQQALQLKKKEMGEWLTNHSIKWGDSVVDQAWKLGDLLWTRYDEKF